LDTKKAPHENVKNQKVNRNYVSH